MELFRNTFIIRPENYAKAADAIRESGMIPPELIEGAEDYRVIGYALVFAGLFYEFTDSGIKVHNHQVTIKDIGLTERVFKTISRSVEPGAYLEFLQVDMLFRYDFLYDTVERCTVPHILYSRREVI